MEIKHTINQRSQFIEFSMEKKSVRAAKFTLMQYVIAAIEELNLDPSRGVIISGRGSTWLYAAITGHLVKRDLPWIATHVPLQGYPVVWSQTPGVEVGGRIVEI